MQDKSIDSVEPDIPEVVWKKKENLYKQSFINTLFITCQANPETPGAPNENIVQNHLNIALLNIF